jgi:hypothetical protein
MMGELEIAAFRTDFRTQQQARAVGLCEIRRVAIALDNAQAFVETGHADAALGAQRLFERQHFRLAAADQQKLVLRVFFQQRDQRFDARIGSVIDLDQYRRLLDVRMELGQQRLARAFFHRVCVEHVPLRHAVGKAADAGAAIAEHRAAGAVAIDQRGEQFARMGRFGGVVQITGQRVIAIEGAGQRVALRGVQRVAVEQLVGDGR